MNDGSGSPPFCDPVLGRPFDIADKWDCAQTLYFVREEPLENTETKKDDAAQVPFKVGICLGRQRYKTSQTRIAALQTGNPRRLYAETFVKLPDHLEEDLRELEKTVHKALTNAGRFIRGEWFYLSNTEAEQLAEFIEGCFALEDRCPLVAELQDWLGWVEELVKRTRNSKKL